MSILQPHNEVGVYSKPRDNPVVFRQDVANRMRPQASAKDGITIALCGAGPFAYALEPAFYCPECQMVMIKKEDGD